MINYKTMRILMFLALLVSIILNLIEGLFFYGLYQKLVGQQPLIDFGYDRFIDKIRGKNFIERDRKIYVVAKYILQPNTIISGVVEINGERKNFKNMTLEQLKQYEGIGKIYINKIGDVNLNGTIELSQIDFKHILYGTVKEESANKKIKK